MGADLDVGTLGCPAQQVERLAWWLGLVLQWWAGDGIAVLVIGGPVLLWSRRRAMASARWTELALVVLAAGAVGGGVPVRRVAVPAVPAHPGLGRVPPR
jgi:hypothetical protein